MQSANAESETVPVEISVVIPLRNEASSVRVLLDAVLRQSLPAKEIVITDAGSSDSTPAIIEEFIDAGAPVKLIRETAAFPGRGRNIGVQNSNSEWIAFTDGGNKPEQNWLASLAEKTRSEPAPDIVYGSYAPVIDSFFKECAAIAYVTAPDPIDGVLGRSRFIASTLVRRQAWQAVGGFPEHLRSAEDLVFMNLLEARGCRIARAPAAVVHWTIQPGLWRTFRRFVTYARNNIRAGLWRQWQLPLFQRYVILALTAAAVFYFGLKWLFASLVLWLGFMMARALRALWLNRICYPATFSRNILRLMMVVPILGVLDLATAVGSIQWLLVDWRRPNRSHAF
jgi:glycosyltransferase involved in cell wall biosynthesis